MKKIGSFTLATIGAVVNILTLLSFIFTTNWKAPTISGLEPADWAIITGILSLYSASLLGSILLQRRNQGINWHKANLLKEITQMERDYGLENFETRMRLEREYDDLKSGFPEIWAHIPFSLPFAILWWRAFVNFPSAPNVIQLAIMNFVLAYILIAMVATLLTIGASSFQPMFSDAI